MKIKRTVVFLSLPLLLFSVSFEPGTVAADRETGSLDERVSKFLENHKTDWHDLNIPASDGKVLYDLVLRNKVRRALEIGTSTGHSAIWIAWALSKTGGRLITIEIDEERHKTALMNFKKAGLTDMIDARLADAHDLVKALKGPFDFVFCDADKDWYKNYFIALAPKLEAGGCFTAHNVSWRYDRGIKAFLDYVYSLPDFKTTISRASSEGISISCKTGAE